MTTFKSTVKIFSFLVFVFAFASIAQAQATRTWVSGVGDDANPCSRTAPCKTFAGAISKTATNGEINCLDPAGYGAVTITKSITIDCEDTQGSILASLVNGVIVNSSTAHVKLRGISINGAGNGINCVRVIAAASLVLDEIVCANFSQHGVSVENSSGVFKLAIWNSSFRNNTGNGVNTFVTGTGTAQVAIETSLFALNGVGVNTGAATTASIANSIVSENTTGIQAGNATSVISAKDNQVTLNGTGFSTLAGATIRLGGNLVSGNGTGLSGGNLFSFGQNFVDGNSVNGVVSGAASVQ
jgi:hypothetical protein